MEKKTKLIGLVALIALCLASSAGIAYAAFNSSVTNSGNVLNSAELSVDIYSDPECSTLYAGNAIFEDEKVDCSVHKVYTSGSAQPTITYDVAGDTITKTVYLRVTDETSESVPTSYDVDVDLPADVAGKLTFTSSVGSATITGDIGNIAAVIPVEITLTVTGATELSSIEGYDLSAFRIVFTVTV